jgi:hypothetical protein
VTAPAAGFVVTVYDKAYNKVGSINGYVSLSVSHDWNAVGAGTLIISEHDPLAGALLACNTSVVPIRVASVNGLWTGRVGHAELSGPVGAGTVTATLVDDWAWFRALLAWPDPTQPLTSQPASSDVTNVPIDTAVKGYISANAQREGIPLYVVPAPSPDPSPPVNLSARFTPIDELCTVPLTMNNRTLTIGMWLPGDPQLAGTTLTSPTLVVDIVRSQDNPRITWTDTFGGVTSRTVTVTAPTAVTALAGGAGALAARYFTTVTDQLAFTNQGNFAFREVFVNASDQAIADRVNQAATASLDNHNAGLAAYSFGVLDGNPWAYGRDYHLGDIGGASLAGVEVRQRITRVTESDDATKGYQVQPILGATSSTETANIAVLRAVAVLAAALLTQNARQ